MGLSNKKSTTTQNSTTSGTTSLTQAPTNPAWVDNGLAGFGQKITDLSNVDPYSLIAGPDALQTQAGQGAAGLTTPGGFGAAEGLAGGVGSAATPSIASHLAELMDPYTNDVVNTTLKGFDQNAGYSRAGDTLARAGDSTFGGSSGAIQTALNEQNIAQGRTAAEAQLRDAGFKTALTGATSQAGLDAGTMAQRLQAAGILSGNATAQGNDARGNIGLQGDLGAILQQLAQQKAGAPVSLLGTTSGLFDGLNLGLLHGQTANGSSNSTTNGTSTSTVSDPLGSLGSLVMGGASLFGAPFTGALGGLKTGLGNYMNNDPTGMWRLGSAGG